MLTYMYMNVTEQERMAEQIAEHRLSVRQTEERVRGQRNGTKPKKASGAEINADIRVLLSLMHQMLTAAKADLKPNRLASE